ncbi:Uncharacterised protein [Mycobacteroides abscessus subsp. abscessus]|nr:Uncharacterised protein [Mycobacteroides abscessus subsp. abscessus]
MRALTADQMRPAGLIGVEPAVDGGRLVCRHPVRLPMPRSELKRVSVLGPNVRRVSARWEPGMGIPSISDMEICPPGARHRYRVAAKVKTPWHGPASGGYR